jgi:hypothetical protein
VFFQSNIKKPWKADNINLFHGLSFALIEIDCNGERAVLNWISGYVVVALFPASEESNLRVMRYDIFKV